MALPARQIVALPVRRSPATAALAALRPRQWSKNLLLFAGLLFAAKLGDALRWLEAAAAFAAYCAASSAAYLFNDVRDAEWDRGHPLKRLRPVARGELAPRTALVLAGGLTLVAFALVAPLGLRSLGFLLAFLVLQGAYSLGLKHVVLVDVFAIAGLFVIRSAAGAAAVDVRISSWLLLVTALLALFLALAKRRSELVLVPRPAMPAGPWPAITRRQSPPSPLPRPPGLGRGRVRPLAWCSRPRSSATSLDGALGSSRPVLDGYSLPLVDQLIAVTVACTIVAYAIYTFTAHSPTLMATIPFVVFGLFRYLLLVHRDDLGEEPENVLLTDRPLVLAVALWALTAAVILSVTS